MHAIHKYKGTYQTNQLKELKVISMRSEKFER